MLPLLKASCFSLGCKQLSFLMGYVHKIFYFSILVADGNRITCFNHFWCYDNPSNVILPNDNKPKNINWKMTSTVSCFGVVEVNIAGLAVIHPHSALNFWWVVLRAIDVWRRVVVPFFCNTKYSLERRLKLQLGL